MTVKIIQTFIFLWHFLEVSFFLQKWKIWNFFSLSRSLLIIALLSAHLRWGGRTLTLTYFFVWIFSFWREIRQLTSSAELKGRHVQIGRCAMVCILFVFVLVRFPNSQEGRGPRLGEPDQWLRQPNSVSSSSHSNVSGVSWYKSTLSWELNKYASDQVLFAFWSHCC